MTKQERLSLIRKLLIDQVDMSYDEFEPVYTAAVREGRLKDAVFVNCLKYLQSDLTDSQEVSDIRSLLGTTIQILNDNGNLRNETAHVHDEKGPYCTWCGKTRDEVQKLISGPGEVFLCNECVAVCQKLLDEV